jgi:hypothetical protein
MTQNLIATENSREMRAAAAAITPSMGARTATEFAASQWGMLALDSYQAPNTVTEYQYRTGTGHAMGHMGVTT